MNEQSNTMNNNLLTDNERKAYKHVQALQNIFYGLNEIEKAWRALRAGGGIELKVHIISENEYAKLGFYGEKSQLVREFLIQNLESQHRAEIAKLPAEVAQLVEQLK